MTPEKSLQRLMAGQDRVEIKLPTQQLDLQMAERLPIHDLAANLESERLREIQALAAKGVMPSVDALRNLAILQAALVAVREEIDEHAVSIGGGSGEPLA